jgi:hypothetical protein
MRVRSSKEVSAGLSTSTRAIGVSGQRPEPVAGPAPDQTPSDHSQGPPSTRRSPSGRAVLGWAGALAGEKHCLPSYSKLCRCVSVQPNPAWMIWWSTAKVVSARTWTRRQTGGLLIPLSVIFIWRRSLGAIADGTSTLSRSSSLREFQPLMKGPSDCSSSKSTPTAGTAWRARRQRVQGGRDHLLCPHADRPAGLVGGPLRGPASTRGKAHPGVERSGKAFKHLRRRKDLARDPITHEPLDDHRAPAQRVTAGVADAKVDRDATHASSPWGANSHPSSEARNSSRSRSRSSTESSVGSGGSTAPGV